LRALVAEFLTLGGLDVLDVFEALLALFVVQLVRVEGGSDSAIEGQFYSAARGRLLSDRKARAPR